MQVNLEDHLCLVATHKTLIDAFNALVEPLEVLNKKFGFARDSKYGWVTTGAQNLGTAMSVRVRISLPESWNHSVSKLENLQKKAKKYGFKIEYGYREDPDLLGEKDHTLDLTYTSNIYNRNEKLVLIDINKCFKELCNDINASRSGYDR
jgi:protein-arginine kinase